MPSYSFAQGFIGVKSSFTEVISLVVKSTTSPKTTYKTPFR